MSAEQLPEKIESLVDHLRGNRDQDLSLADVASVTEVLIGTMQAYFKSIDTTIYRECRTLSDYISNARKEIASLQPGDLETTRIPRAGMELDAIVQQTEEATNTIMESAEAIMGADPADVEGFQKAVQDNIVKIFEACSFQDITGQRISKVVQTLSYVEDRLNEFRTLLGVTEEDVADARASAPPPDESEDLTRGPSLAGEGIDQDEVDALLNGEPVGQALRDTPSGEAAAPERPAKKPKRSAAAKKSGKARNGEADAPPKAKAAESGAEAAPSRQEEIDALFG